MASPDDYRRAAGFRRSEAEQQDSSPIRQGSPEAPAEAPQTGTNMFTRAYDGFAVGAAWLSQLAVNDDSILKREGIQDLRLFDALLDDDVAFTAFQQRQLALLARPWTVEPGDPKDPRSVLAADDLRDMINSVGWDRITRRMTYGIWYGFAVAEAIYGIRQHRGRTVIWLDDVIVPDRKWFAFTNAGELRMRTPTDQNGVPVPANKFWSYRTGATHDFAHYGTGLAHWCYWPIWFKRNVLQFWALYLEKFGQPTVVGYFQPGASDEAVAELLNSLKAIGSDSAVAIPAPPSNAGQTGGGSDLRPQLMEATRGGSGAQSYLDFVSDRNDALRGVILGQPGTSSGVSGGLGSDQAGMHKDVRDEVIKADSDEIHESFNGSIAKWLTLWNHGPDVAPPTLYRSMDDGEDLNTTAERDSNLKEQGWRRTEDSFREVYGDGYERTPDPVPVVDPRLAQGGNRLPRGANDNQANADAIAVAQFAAGDAAPLYISRKLKPATAKRLLAHAREAGIVGLVDAADMHVTICYSRNAVDWFDMPEDYWSDQDGGMVVKSGGPRAFEKFGDKATVLMFGCREFKWRHRDLEEAGASHDWPGYYAHVTVAKGEQTIDLEAVEPFTDALEFGPEIWERLDTDPVGAPLIPAFSADQLDVIDTVTAGMLEDTDPLIRAFAGIITERLATFEAATPLTAAGLRVALLQALEQFPEADMARVMALPFAAERAAAAAGVEDLVQA